MRIRSTAAPIVLAILSLGTSVTASAEAVTYDFSGVATSATGAFFPLAGTGVSGSFTIDFGAASQSAGTLGSSDWFTFSTAAVPSAPAPSALVFSESITFGGTTYTSSALDPDLRSLVQASGGSLLLGVAFSSDIWHNGSWGINLQPVESTGVTSYLSNGLPNLEATDFNVSSGYFTSTTGSLEEGTTVNDLEFSFASITPESGIPNGGLPVPLAPLPSVPLPAAVWLLAAGLGVLGGFRPGRVRR